MVMILKVVKGVVKLPKGFDAEFVVVNKAVFIDDNGNKLDGGFELNN